MFYVNDELKGKFICAEMIKLHCNVPTCDFANHHSLNSFSKFDIQSTHHLRRKCFSSNYSDFCWPLEDVLSWVVLYLYCRQTKARRMYLGVDSVIYR